MFWTTHILAYFSSLFSVHFLYLLVLVGNILNDLCHIYLYCHCSGQLMYLLILVFSVLDNTLYLLVLVGNVLYNLLCHIYVCCQSSRQLHVPAYISLLCSKQPAVSYLLFFTNVLDKLLYLLILIVSVPDNSLYLLITIVNVLCIRFTVVTNFVYLLILVENVLDSFM